MAVLTVVLLVCLFTCAVTQSTDPCGAIRCQSSGYECRLFRVSCADDVQCPPQPICVPAQGKLTSCNYGLPVLDQTGEQIYSPSTCDTSKNNCPDDTQCQIRPEYATPVCCWTPFQATRTPTTKPPTNATPLNPFGQVSGYCAKTFPLPALFCQWVVPSCTSDRDCLQGSKCCYTEKCGRKGCLLARLQPECSFLDKILGLCT